MTTRLDRELKRQVNVEGTDYTITIDPTGLRLTGKGRRKPQVELRWHDLLSGEAALATALNASLSSSRSVTSKKTARSPATAQPTAVRKQAPRKRSG